MNREPVDVVRAERMGPPGWFLLVCLLLGIVFALLDPQAGPPIAALDCTIVSITWFVTRFVSAS